MKAYFWEVAVTHDKCGQDGSIVHIHARADGSVVFTCLCILCGEEYQLPTSVWNILRSCTQFDTARHNADPVEQMLDNFEPKGKPN